MRNYSPLGQWIPYPQERFLWDGLREKWPQLNDRSRIIAADNRSVFLPDGMETLTTWADSWEYKPIWRSGLRAWVMRALGVLFNEPHWFNFGSVELVRERGRVSPIARVKTREIRLELFGATANYGRDYSRSHDQETIQIGCAYDVQTDTLFIKLFRPKI